MNGNELAVLVDGKSTKELIVVDTHNKIIESIENYLNEDRFNYVVTSDNLKEVKSNNTELNASIKVIKEFGKKLVDLESEDINTFESNIKLYWEKIEQKRQDRLKYIEVFESQTKEKLKDLISIYVHEQYQVLNIKSQFKKVSYDDLILISNITSKGALTKAVKDTLNMRLQICKSSQDNYVMRVLQLENICLKRGLETPLTVNHIQGIIYESDDSIYESKLNKLIDDELERFAQIKLSIEKAEKEKAENEAKIKVDEQVKKVNSLFTNAFGMLDIEDLEKEQIKIQNIDITKFDLCLSHAQSMKEKALTRISQAIWAKKKALEDTKKVIDVLAPTFKSDEAVKEIDNPFEEVKEVIKNSDEAIINARFKIAGVNGLKEEQILKSIKDILFSAGVCEDSLLTLEVEK